MNTKIVKLKRTLLNFKFELTVVLFRYYEHFKMDRLMQKTLRD